MLEQWRRGKGVHVGTQLDEQVGDRRDNGEP